MLLTGASLSAEEMRLEDSAELRIRAGLPNAGAKLERGENLTVVFIGGSITRGGGESGYVRTVEKWLREKWPNSAINVINAGISGTDSNFGAKRYDRDVLIHEPDLVLIEFAVNDGSRDHTAHMERMVHKTWLKNAETGTYAFRVSAAGLSTWRNEDTDFAFNVAKFAWGEKFGESLVHFRAKRRDIEPFSLEGETHLIAGEEIVVIIASDSPGHIRGGWEDFRLDIGLMDNHLPADRLR